MISINAIVGNWQLVQALGHVIGDFTWTGWDYLGEVGIGRLNRESDTSSGDGFRITCNC